jgi:type IV pilus assembly protein PilN
MIRINLLPYRAARTKENIRKQVSVFILSFILLLILLVVGQGILSARTTKMSQKLDGLKKEVAVYEEKAKMVEDFKKRLDLLEKQIKVVDQLKAKREEPPKLLAKITEMVIAGRMQLTRMKADDTSVDMDGTAMDNNTIAEFMTRLERCGLFTDVKLASSKQMIQFDVEMKQFQIQCKRPVVKSELDETPAEEGKKSKKTKSKAKAKKNEA